MLEIKNLCVDMNDKPLLKNINMVIQDGARHRLAGHNGSGKSTLVNTIAGDSSYTITSGQSAYSGTEDPLATSANTAIQVMGNGWNKPTRRTMVNELTANTTYTWETNFNGSGVNGGKFTSTANTNAYVFFPASGYYNKGANAPRNFGSYAYFWTRNTTSEHYPYDFYMYTGGFKLTNHTRTIAIPVRGIHGAL